MNVAYFLQIFGNFPVTDNLRVEPSDFGPYCVTVPDDPRLPGAGSQRCGFVDLNANRVGQIENLITNASNYGDQVEHWNGVDLTVNATLRNLLLRGSRRSVDRGTWGPVGSLLLDRMTLAFTAPRRFSRRRGEKKP